MLFKSFFFLKLFLTLIFFLLGIYLIINNYNKLEYQLANNTNKKVLINKNSYTLKDSEINFTNNNKINKDNYLYKNEESGEENKKILNEISIFVKRNDTFSKIIDPLFENNKLKNSIINKINEKFNLQSLNINQKIIFYSDNQNIIKKIIFPINFDTDLILEISDNKLNLYEKKYELIKDIKAFEFKINSSLYEDGLKAGIPINILSEVIKLYSFDLDFQRDIKKNTNFQILFETFYNSKRETNSYGNIEYINLTIEKKDLEYFLFKDNNNYDYYNKEGKNIKKSLLKTPIDGARLSSNFGMRKHPISGYNKLHKGVDFAAPKGTPIYAGGNGVIEYVGKNGGYGKYIRIRHNNNYKTAYAHLSKYKKGISVGRRVNQGETIGYVGSTGNSTGPHLHYEIIFKNKQINPMKMKLPSGKILKNAELEKFTINRDNIYAKYLYTLYE